MPKVPADGFHDHLELVLFVIVLSEKIIMKKVSNGDIMSPNVTIHSGTPGISSSSDLT